MNIPPLLIGGVLIFWGIETDRLLIGVILALITEGHHFISTRYDLDEDDFVKISDLTSLIFLGGIALILLNNEPVSFLRITTGWVPLIFSPLIIAQLYSTGNTITIGTRLGKKEKAYTHKPIDFRIYYIINCIFAAATGNSRSVWFYVILAALILYLVFKNRGPSYSPVVFLLLLFFTFGAGYLMSVGIEKSHRYVMQSSFRFLHRYYRGQFADPYKTHVNFGDTGRLKYSGKIIMRIDSDDQPPSLFREASFTTYRNGDWFGNQGEYEFLPTSADEVWDLAEPPHPQGERFTVELSLPKEKGLLPYPAGGFQLASSTIFELEQHRNGTVKIVDGAPVALYELAYDPLFVENSGPPRGRNLELPAGEEYVFEQILEKLNVQNHNPAAQIDAIKNFFSTDFSYSLQLLGKGDFDTPLGNFLLGRKSGFCEYYATATTLLLRYLNIPSRYSVGYVVEEKSLLEGKYIVRNRHAHAWAEAYVDGRWLVVDTTPPDWLNMDAERASPFEQLQDLFNLINHKYKLFQIGTGRDYTLFFSIVVVILTTFLVFRIYRRMKLEEAGTDDEGRPPRSFERIETPFTPLLDSLQNSSVKREGDEPYVSWAARSYPWDNFDRQEFAALYSMHLRLRFDAESAHGVEKDHLEKMVRKYLKELEKIRDE